MLEVPVRQFVKVSLVLSCPHGIRKQWRKDLWNCLAIRPGQSQWEKQADELLRTSSHVENSSAEPKNFMSDYCRRARLHWRLVREICVPRDFESGRPQYT